MVVAGMKKSKLQVKLGDEMNYLRIVCGNSDIIEEGVFGKGQSSSVSRD